MLHFVKGVLFFFQICIILLLFFINFTLDKLIYLAKKPIFSAKIHLNFSQLIMFLALDLRKFINHNK